MWGRDNEHRRGGKKHCSDIVIGRVKLGFAEEDELEGDLEMKANAYLALGILT